MFSFKAYFWNNDVYIDEKFKYAVNEILTAYLNSNFHIKIEKNDFVRELNKLKIKLCLTDDMDYYNYQNYNSNVYKAISIIGQINSFILKMPPYNKILKSPLPTLEDILNDYSFLFEDGLDSHDDINLETETEYGFGECDEYGNYSFQLHRFEPMNPDMINDMTPDMIDSLNEMNNAIELYFDYYINFLKSYSAVNSIFKPFITDYLHTKETFLSDNDVATLFNKYTKLTSSSFQTFDCKMNNFKYKIIKDNDNKSILCEEISFADLQSFLYFDFFNGIKKNYIPNICKQCGKFFLIKGGKYFSYCDSPLKEDPSKSCRDVGARRRYDDKCKNDPIWQTYNRAYKAHYARYMKKKMSISEFEEWSRFASELRDKAIAEEIDYDSYYETIRK